MSSSLVFAIFFGLIFIPSIMAFSYASYVWITENEDQRKINKEREEKLSYSQKQGITLSDLDDLTGNMFFFGIISSLLSGFFLACSLAVYVNY